MLKLKLSKTFSIKNVLFLLISINFFLNFSCNSTEPTDDLKPGRRDYTWTVDTLSYPGSNQTLMKGIWGQNPNDVWVIGHNERGFGKMYHFDGNDWLPVDLTNIPAPILYSIVGFDQNDIFVAGSANYIIDNQLSDSSLILKYNGNNWEISLINIGSTLLSISGKDADIFAVGRNKTYFQYNGINWDKRTFNFTMPIGYTNNFASAVLIRSNSKLIMYQCSSEHNTIYYFLIYEDNQWIKLDSFYNTSLNGYKWGTKLWECPDGDVYSVYPYLYKLTERQWVNVLSDDLYTTINGTSNNNIFLAGYKVLHFNGANWYSFDNISNKFGLASDILCFENEIFIVFNSNGKTIIVNGKIK